MLGGVRDPGRKVDPAPASGRRRARRSGTGRGGRPRIDPRLQSPRWPAPPPCPSLTSPFARPWPRLAAHHPSPADLSARALPRARRPAARGPTRRSATAAAREVSVRGTSSWPWPTITNARQRAKFKCALWGQGLTCSAEVIAAGDWHQALAWPQRAALVILPQAACSNLKALFEFLSPVLPPAACLLS